MTHTNFVCDLQPLKEEMYRVRMTVGGDKLDYPHETASPTAASLDTKSSSIVLYLITNVLGQYFVVLI